jgi:hypothetical protein
MMIDDPRRPRRRRSLYVERDLARILEGKGSGVESQEIHEIELESSKDMCDPMDTREEAEGEGKGSAHFHLGLIYE